MNKVFVKSYAADAAIGARLIVKVGAADGSVAQASAATDAVIGVADSIGQDTAAGMCDVVMAGIAEVVYGGTVTRGDNLVADANGKAVAESAGAGSNVNVIGVAMTSGVADDIGEVFLAVGSLQG